MKIYAKVKGNGEYHNHNIAQSACGFMEMGAEVVKYELIDDIYDVVTKEDIVIDYIEQTQRILNKFGVVPMCEDYPEPNDFENYSGQFKLRIPKSLHKSLSEHSKAEGISMNQYCLYLLTKNDSAYVG